MAAHDDICFMPAVDQAEAVRKKHISAAELMRAHLDQIERINPKVNALVTMVSEDEAMSRAREADEALARGDETGPLHGLPMVHKDLLVTKDITTTFGSPIYRDYVPDHDNLMIERLKGAGAISLGKSNTPEFGAGAQTFNAVFGETLNPYDLEKTCGGSSGGSAVALATGMVPVADGTDMGGSLRIPAAFCNIVGLRPSMNRVPIWPTVSAWSPLQVDGPMGRTVQDVALAMSVIAGPDGKAPMASTESADIFRRPLDRDFKGTKIAWSRDMGGLPMDRRIVKAMEAQIPTFTDMGIHVEEATPDFTDADEVFRALRAWHFEMNFGRLLETNKDQLKDAVIWNIEEGLQLTGPALARTERLRTALYHRVRTFLEEYEFLILPVTAVPPFDVKQQYVEEIDGIKMETYIDWLRTCYFITVTGLPAASVPCGFTDEGLPVGMQIVGRPHDDFGVLQLAYAFQEATEFWKQRPAVVD